jgi:YegS/Rv2252/BmrU family lipid kinase
VSRRFLVLVNPAAARGRALRRLPTVRAELDRFGAEHRVVQTTSLDHAVEETRAAVSAGETVATLGGDGFVRPVAGALRGADSALAVLPGGRGNDFARAVGIPNDVAASVRTAVEGVERMVDVAAVDGEPYLGIASYGIDSDVQELANTTRVARGSLVYLYATLRGLARWRPARFRVRVDGEEQAFEGFSAAVANSGIFGGGMRLAPHAKLDDGRLDVLLGPFTSKRTYLRSLAKVFKGTHLDLPEIKVLSGQSIHLDSDPAFDVYADGDVIGRTPATVTVRPRCLRVIVPT